MWTDPACMAAVTILRAQVIWMVRRRPSLSSMVEMNMDPIKPPPAYKPLAAVLNVSTKSLSLTLVTNLTSYDRDRVRFIEGEIEVL